MVSSAVSKEGNRIKPPVGKGRTGRVPTGPNLSLLREIAQFFQTQGFTVNEGQITTAMASI